ncbi:MAG: glycosyltransferase family 4 protein [Tepidisphaeraceae bacterium]|jgi:glycosyltransferase involved in cell wall biosynthesis
MPPRVCIVGQNASLKFGGEASLPWWCFKYLRARGVDAHLVVHGRTRSEVQAGFPDDLDRLHFIPETRIDRLLWRMGSFLPGRLDAQTLMILRHIYNQRLQKRIVRRLIAEKNIQIVHEISPVSPKQVSLMYGLGVPVVIGPLAGGMTYPPAFANLETFGAGAMEGLGRAMSHAFNFFMPGKRKAAGLIVANEQTRAALPHGTTGKIYTIPDVGVDLSVWKDSADTPARDDGLVRFCYLGRLVDWKGVEFLLRAFALVAEAEPTARLDILGDGDQRKFLEDLQRELNLTERVTFVGWVSGAEGAKRLREADALVLPSLHEVGGIVILEAMAVGLPVIAANWGGPGVHVSDETGIRVNPDSREGFVKGLAEAMLKLVRSPELRGEMSRAAKLRVRTNFYDWNQKIDRISEIYDDVLGDRRASSPAARGD